MQTKIIYNTEILKDIMNVERTAEDLVREILGKMCPYHGLRANVEMSKKELLTVSACCEEFHALIKKIIYDFEQRPNKTIVKDKDFKKKMG
jgi:hypothetical protein